MSKMILGSLCLTDILAKAKEKHSAFSRSEKNGKAYMNIVVFENDEPDQYGNHFSVQLGVSKDAPESEKKIYIGNMKYKDQPAKETTNDTSQRPVNTYDDDLPF